ncbi:phosphoribosyltransferase family protein [Frankia sp. CcI49]|uniref:phosphoribosyltransferase family protein n=1 Tax=Frankia sp. CcI49 TaxID=1745382 RepID=UPI000A033120|nr:phosphoribosyltransferase family protein [Frankia sp. CcI49]
MTAVMPGEGTRNGAAGQPADHLADPPAQTPAASLAASLADEDWLWEALGLGVEIRGGEPADELDELALRRLVGLALRRNPRRAHLLVSRVLGKHLPVPPEVALDAGARLAALVRALPEPGRWAGPGPAAAPVPIVIGYCETATALGHAVADGLPNSHYLHTTRRQVPGSTPLLEFVESHSHATHHWLMPQDPDVLAQPGRLLLVDDELSTGRTALGTIRILHAFAPRTDYAVAALVDARPPAARAAFAALAAELGVRIDVVSLVAATVAVPVDVTERATRIRGSVGTAAAPEPAPGPAVDGSAHGAAGADAAGSAATGGAAAGDAGSVDPADTAGVADPADPAGAAGAVTRVTVPWPAGLPDGARHGWSQHTRERLTAELPAVADEVLAGIGAARGGDPSAGGDILVLGTEELMYVPMRLAQCLVERTERRIFYQSTTRSPVHPLDVDGYAIRSALTFPAPDDPSRVSHVYNVAPGRYEDIVVVVDAALDGRGPVPGAPAVDGLVVALGACAPVTVVTIPSHVPPRPAPAAGGHPAEGAV